MAGPSPWCAWIARWARRSPWMAGRRGSRFRRGWRTRSRSPSPNQRCHPGLRVPRNRDDTALLGLLLPEKASQQLERFRGLLFRDEVAAVEGLTADVIGPFAPDGEGVVPGGQRALAAPEDLDGAGD